MNKQNLVILLWEKLFKQIKTIEDQGQKQVEALNTLKFNKKVTIEDVIPKNAFNSDEAKKELDKIKEKENSIDREKLVYINQINIHMILENFKQKKIW